MIVFGKISGGGMRSNGGLSLLLFDLLLASCEKHMRWQEEVKLSTGEVIVVDRDVRHKGGGAAWPHGQGSIPREHVIRFLYPAQTGPVIEWRSTKLSPATYAELPLALDINDDKSWIIFTHFWEQGCRVYVKYQFQNGVWREILLTEDIESRPTNMFLAAG